ncbi:exodeoxyribonuclease III [Methanohalophilus portucalensis]|uniref:Exodeoxyribonuclease III n=1 Tax=Methanohalophilus portucalensis TaxID=39664 RepID=A0A2D3C6Y2_9EURY|nr:exodeoxyribonuclease III [Methanohalophilus portucalensis]ATU08464.1 exodeoxyribonuclease III [Methanohalophilus portucalensis]
MLSWNVNGLRAVAKKGFLEWFDSESPDILCLQETKARPSQLPPNVRRIDGYYSYFSAAERKGYSGVALYSKVQPQEVRYGFGINRFDHEGRILIAFYDDFVLFNIYFPNGNSSAERLQYKMDFYESFLDYAQGLKDKGYSIVVCGDLNTAHKPVDIARPKQNENRSGFLPIEREWIDKFLSHGFLDTFRLFNNEGGNYTWWDLKTKARDRNVGWRLDYFFVSDDMELNVTEASILREVTGSDHCPVGITLQF